MPGELAPSARDASGEDARRLAGPGGARTQVAEALAKNPGERQPQFAGQLADFLLRLVDHVAAGFGVLAVRKAVADGPDAAAHAVARLDDGHRRAHGREVVSRGESGETCPGDQDRYTGQGGSVSGQIA